MIREPAADVSRTRVRHRRGAPHRRRERRAGERSRVRAGVGV